MNLAVPHVRSLLAVLVIVALSLPQVAVAGALKAGGVDWDDPVVSEVARDSMSLNEAVSRAKRSFPGRVLRAETQNRGDRRIHVVRILNEQGKVRTLRFDAKTGKPL